jgi:hypothetical protein
MQQTGVWQRTRPEHGHDVQGIAVVAQPLAEPIKDCWAEWLLEGRLPGWLHVSKCGT